MAIIRRREKKLASTVGLHELISRNYISLVGISPIDVKFITVCAEAIVDNTN